MSILTALLGAAIGLVVMAGLVTMINNIFKSQRTAQTRDAHRELVENIRKLLADPNICSATFAGVNPHGLNGTTLYAIKDQAGNATYVAGNQYLNNLITIDSFKIRDFKADNPVTNPNLGKAELLISMDKIGSTIGSKTLVTPIYIQALLSAGKISQCVSLAGDMSLWQVSPDNKANIFYPYGNVGVGVSNPLAKLDVAGEVKIGNTSTGCDASKEGMLRYNYTTHSMEYCGGDPLQWSPLLSNSGSSTTTEIVVGSQAGCPTGKQIKLRHWITKSCSNYGNTCNLYQGWSGAPPSCESCVDWEKCHICYSKAWDAVECM